MYYGRYQHLDGRWMKWLKFPGPDDAIRHCLSMAVGREIDLLSEADYNLKYGEKPSPQVTDTTGAFEGLTERLEGPEARPRGEQRAKRRVGRPRIDNRPSKAALQRMYADQGLSIRTIAEELGLSRDTVHRTLQEYGIETRSSFRASRLAKYPLEYIRERVKALGYARAAREFEISLSALYFYVNTR